MQRNSKRLIGHSMEAMDGDIVKVEEFYIEDTRWVIRYPMLIAMIGLAVKIFLGETGTIK